MIPKPFEALDRVDIENLVAEGRAERRTLEYKEKLPNLGLEQDKYEFLFDVCSFANASGGDILYGVKDKRDADGKPTGIPESSPGVSVPNADAAILQLTQVVRSSIDPKIPGFQMKAIPGFASGPVVLARIPRSYVSPHLVRNDKQWLRFYSRGSNGKQLLDVGEIRSAFTLQASLGERVRHFRDERLARIVADDTPMAVRPGPRTVLHLLPIAALDAPPLQVDVAAIASRMSVFPHHTVSPNNRFNFDGLLYYTPPSGREPCPIYLQVFRNGAIEVVETRMVSNKPGWERTLAISPWEKSLIDTLTDCLHLQREIGITPPIFMLLSLLGVNGHHVPHGTFGQTAAAIDRDTLLLPDVLLDDYPTDVDVKMMTMFNAIWQASGWPKCRNQDGHGRWKDRSDSLM